MRTTICIPLYSRVKYLSEVYAGMVLLTKKEGVSVCVGVAPTTPPVFPKPSLPWKEIPVPRNTKTSSETDANVVIRMLFDDSFAAGADSCIYLADDCIPSPDFVELAEFMAKQDHAVAFGMWWPTGDSALKYPELVLNQRGHGWPSKSFGCTVKQWPAVRKVMMDTEARMLFDSALADYLHESRGVVVTPVLSRVRDIGVDGGYNSPERWVSDYSWIAWAPAYAGSYILI